MPRESDHIKSREPMGFRPAETCDGRMRIDRRIDRIPALDLSHVMGDPSAEVL